MSFSIDGITWSYPCKIERKTEIKETDISGLMLNKHYFSDVEGTWTGYSLALPIPVDRASDYYAIYEQLTAPVGSHDFVMPYNGGTLTFEGRVSSVNDVWVEMSNGNFWRGTEFTIIANNPCKTEELGEVVTRGVGPVPILPWSGYVRFYIDDNGDLHSVTSRYGEVDFYIDSDGVLHSISPGDIIQYTSYGWSRYDPDAET